MKLADFVLSISVDFGFEWDEAEVVIPADGWAERRGESKGPRV